MLRPFTACRLLSLALALTLATGALATSAHAADQQVLDEQARRLEAQVGGPSFEAVMAEERRLSHSYGGRSVFGLEPPAAETGAA